MFDKTINLLSKAMDMYLVRHLVITDNIANAETPGFKSRRVDFEAELRKANQGAALKSDGEVQRDIASVKPLIYEDLLAEVGLDRNSVDMDREMAALSKNEVKFTAASKLISKKMALLKYAINEGM